MSVLTDDDTGRRQQNATPSSDPDRVTGAETQTQATKQKSDVKKKKRRDVRLGPKTTYIMYVIVYQHILYHITFDHGTSHLCPRHPASKMVFTVAADAHAAAPASAVIFPGPPRWKSARAASNNCRQGGLRKQRGQGSSCGTKPAKSMDL